MNRKMEEWIVLLKGAYGFQEKQLEKEYDEVHKGLSDEDKLYGDFEGFLRKLKQLE